MDTHGRRDSNVIIIVGLFATANLDLVKSSTEAVAWRCFLKELFSKISQNSVEKTCGGILFL